MIVLSGASASGKTEVAKMLHQKYGIVKVITTTTREKRIHEKNGVDYFFVDQTMFDQMIKDDKFVEYTKYNDKCYGSTKDQIANDKCIVVDLAGLNAYINLKNNHVISFFLEASEEKRFKRMIERGDDLEKAKSRIAHDREAFKDENIPKVDFKIESECSSVEEVTDKIYQIYINKINN